MGTDKHSRQLRRMDSCEDEYEEDRMYRRRDKKPVKAMSASRSRENFDSENWYQLNEHRNNWSLPPNENETSRNRSFERSSYERSTYGPPYEKRDEKNYDRRDYKSYDKRKYHREYCRPSDYDFDPYRDAAKLSGSKDRKLNYYENDYDRRGVGPPQQAPVVRRNDYDDMMFDGTCDRESRDSRGSHKSQRGYSYERDRDRKSFDRESADSYESGRRRKSFGSQEMYGSLDSRGEYRDRHLPAAVEKTRSWRKGMRARPEEEYEQDSESEAGRRYSGDTKSVQRTAPPRLRKSSGSSPWDGEGL